MLCKEIAEIVGTVVTERRGLFQNVTGERSCTVTELATVRAEDFWPNLNAALVQVIPSYFNAINSFYM